MGATRKQYNGDFTEDALGKCVGVENIDAFGNTTKFIFRKIGEINNATNYATVIFVEFIKPNGTNDWFQKPDYVSTINNSIYRYVTQDANFGKIEAVPFEDDRTQPIKGSNPIAYVQKLKTGLMGESDFFYMGVFEGSFGIFPLNDMLFETILELKGWTL